MKLCHCGQPRPIQTTLSYQFKSPSGYTSEVEIECCATCGPKALREAAAEIAAWADVMEGPEPNRDPPADWMPTEDQWDRYSMTTTDDRYKLRRENCKPGDKRLWRLFQLWGRSYPEPLEERDCHTEHCCADHGCKYSDPDCPVTSGIRNQTGLCETCGLELEGYFDGV